ncbi:hypothetical protein FGG78_25060 [Thioclava sp. BHET1]|nr:hypothetical protein FGG78_25060 [Thioclava sp. BHET1]
MRKAFIHMGMPKTGSTALQAALHEHAPLLKRNGLLHPDTEFLNSAGLITLFHPMGMKHHFLKNNQISDSLAQDYANKLWDQIRSSKNDIVLSSEYLHNVGRNAQSMGEAFVTLGYEPVFIFYLRHPVDFATSLAQQNVKMGHKTLAEVIANPVWHGMKTALLPHEQAGHKLIVRNYSEIHMNGIVLDFFRAIGYRDLGSQIPNATANSGMTMDGTILADLYWELMRRHGRSPFERRDILNVGNSRFSLPEQAKAKVRNAGQNEVEWITNRFAIELKESQNEAEFRTSLSPASLTHIFEFILEQQGEDTVHPAPPSRDGAIKRLLSGIRSRAGR